MIPKIIHYCWFGRGEKPAFVNKCISSWKKHLPEYRLIEWNEDNFDVNINSFCKGAYESKKYAFITDYVRLEAMYSQGGVYMDTDVEILKPLDRFLHHPAFSGFENESFVPTGLMAAEQGNPWIKELMDHYEDKYFDPQNMTTNTKIITDTCLAAGLNPNGEYQELANGVVFYPRTFFCPFDYVNGDNFISKDSHAIHHFSKSWLPWHVRFQYKLKLVARKIFGRWIIILARKVKESLTR
jgi:hypothetical protein